jgi:1-acyl-sn-glycerol-3-phosphate acyltransferase
MPCRKFFLARCMYHLLRPLVYPVFYLRYRMRFSLSDEVKAIKGPAVLLGNHVNQWDPFFAAIGMRRPVHFIASDFVFRKPLLAGLLRSLGAVPKVKFRSDMGSLRTLMDVRRCGGVIGIFPEGHVNWAGRTLDIVPSTGKLVRLLKAPVIALVIKGGYISRPRWRGRRYAPGEQFEYRQIISADEIKSLSVASINARIQEALDHNEWDYLREHPRRIPSSNRAEGLERALFICPDCGRYSPFESSGDGLRCTSCPGSVEIGEDGFPAGNSFSMKFADISEWDRWQQSRLSDQIRESLDGRGSGPIFSEADTRIAQSSDGTSFDRRYAWGVLEFHGKTIVLNGDDRLEIEVGELSGIAVQNSEEIEFYLGNTLTKIEFARETACSYKWYSALTEAQKQLRVFEEI